MSFGLNTFQQYSSGTGLGNNGVKVALSYFDGIPDQAHISSLRSSELQLIFKSLLKRDDTTKEKALAELLQLIENPSTDKHVLKDDILCLCWSQMYAKMVVNDLKSIRSAAHQITTRLIKLLKKDGTRYLKDFIPLLLSGLYDIDISVSRSTSANLLDCFNDDVSKIQALWKLFPEQILNYVREVIVVESEGTLSDERYVAKKDAELRYIRVVTGSILLLIHLLKACREGVEAHKDVYYEILSTESLWKLLSFKNNGSIKAYQAILQLMDVLMENGDFQNNEDVFKMAVKTFFKFMAQINSKNIIFVSQLLTRMVSTLVNLNRFQDGRIWSRSKSFKTTAFQFLLLSTEVSESSYYPKLYELYKGCKVFSYLTDWILLWRKHVEKEFGRKLQDRNSEQLLVECWKHYWAVVQDSEDHETRLTAQKEAIMLLHAKRLGDYPTLVDILMKVFPVELLSEEIKNKITTAKDIEDEDAIYIENLLTVLLSNSNNKESVRNLAKLVLGTLENGDDHSIEYGLRIFQRIINSGNTLAKEEVDAFAYQLPIFMNESRLELPSKILSDYSKSRFLDNPKDDTTLSIFSDYIIVIKQLDISKSQAFSLIDNLSRDILHALSGSSPDYIEFIDEYIRTYDFNDKQVFHSNLLSKNVLKKLYYRALSSGNMVPFASSLMKLPSEFYFEIFENTSFLDEIHNTLPKSLIEEVMSLLLPLVKENNNIAKRVAKSVLFEASSRKIGESDDLINYALRLIDANNTVVTELFPSDIGAAFINYVPKLDHSFAIYGPSDVVIHLLDISPEDKFDVEQAHKGLNYAFFLHSLVSTRADLQDDNLLLFFTMMSELEGHYRSINPKSRESSWHFQNTIFRQHLHFDPHDIFISIIEGFSDSKILNWLVSRHNSPVVIFYNCRILRSLLQRSFVSTSFTEYEERFNSNKFIQDIVRATNASYSERLFAATLLGSTTKFRVDSANLARTRNMLAAELIGLKGQTSVIKSTNIIILYLTLVRVETDNEDLTAEPVSAQRLNMLVSNIHSWLDSDYCYDDSFAEVRLALVMMVIEFLRYPSVQSKSQTFCDLAVRLLVDSLSLCQIPDTLFLSELGIAVLKLYQILAKLVAEDKIDDTTWSNNIEEVQEAIIQMGFNTTEINGNEPPIAFYNNLNIVLSAFPEKSFTPHFQLFMDMALSESNDLCLLRSAISVLRRLILAQQQEFVIEYELKKSNLGSESDTLNLTAELPESLIEKLINNMPHYLLEHENPAHFIRYLWYWHICLSYFKDVSYSIRHEYVNQLKKHGLIDDLLDFISEQIDLQDPEFRSANKAELIVHYDVLQESLFTEDVSLECKILMVSLLYEVFNNISAAPSHWWLNIKDRSLKTKIDTFVSTWVSPILINNELELVNQRVGKLTEQNDSLTIKINKITREIKAKYLIDDQNLELSFKLPSNYPLTNIQVIEGARVGVNEQKWKSWILSTQRVISSMEGSIIDSLELFTKNVKLQFSNFDDCAICYCILHAVDRKLPNKVCPTCNNRFHGACLYKWFKSSGNNTCPLCRGEIPFRR
ncbi:HBL201Wp [Eremothecium sinecaudum]|uniref:E3 ubiquitin-protein ligase listerin n=1 Tax=Eremothecium sinecaudum TaxID=45286 RepID=A0A109UW70_9SACH|nr:HBL201Wp [Eremothecium sinecaudum]AMD18701.1 HBL201Wp [Eremothecium sinecaudum]